MKAILYTDGGARGNPGPAGIGYVLTLEDGREMTGQEYIGTATNNQAEYKALLAGMKRASDEGVQELECKLDSELVVRQMTGEYRIKDVDLKPLAEQVKTLAAAFTQVSFGHVRREHNKQADTLVNRAIDEALTP